MRGVADSPCPTLLFHHRPAPSAQISQRKGNVTTVEGAEYCTISAEVPLDAMFGYSNDLRGATQGKGEYSMEYKFHQPTSRDKQAGLADGAWDVDDLRYSVLREADTWHTACR